MTISPPTTRSFLLALTGAVIAGWIAGCATEPLDAGAPGNVNLSGEWKLNLNLSDDPDKLGNPDSGRPFTPDSGGHHSRGGVGRGGGGGMPPIGQPDGPSYNLGTGSGGVGSNFATSGFNGVVNSLTSRSMQSPGAREAALSGNWGSGLMAAGGGDSSSVSTLAPEQSAPLPPTDAAPSNAPPIGAPPARRPGRALQAPDHLSISQKGATVTVKANMPDGTVMSDAYTAGTQTTIPYNTDDTADRSAGWRGPIFVVTTKAKKGGWREDDYALDDDGRLIMTTLAKGGHMGKIEIKRVYDRVRG